MSWASDHPVFCARRKDLGCPAQHPGGRHAAIQAHEEGWFQSKAEGQDYCPAHVPDWVEGWRAKQQERQFEVKDTFSRLPAALACSGCALTDTADDEDSEAGEDSVRDLRHRAYLHVQQTGHTVTVVTIRELRIEAVRD